VRQVRKTLGSSAAARASAARSEIRRIPTGSLSLDRELRGGWARGRMVELWGPEASGKTTIAILAMRSAVAAGGVAAYVDVEHALDIDYAEQVGLHPDSYVYSNPIDAETALEAVRMFIRNGVDVIVCDTVAALATKAELRGEIQDEHVARLARLMSRACKMMVAEVKANQVVVIFVNQIRQNVGVRFGNPETTPGGRALKYYASTRCEFRGAEKIKETKDGDPVGMWVKVFVKKTKTSIPFKRARFPLIFGKGVDRAREALALALSLGVVTKAKRKKKGEEEEAPKGGKKGKGAEGGAKKKGKSGIAFGERKWRGEAAFLKAAAEDPALLDQIEAEIARR